MKSGDARESGEKAENFSQRFVQSNFGSLNRKLVVWSMFQRIVLSSVDNILFF